MNIFGVKFNPFTSKKIIPNGLFTKCPKCEQTVYNKEVDNSLKTCPKCEYHFTMGAWDRVNMMIDQGTFNEYDKDLTTVDPLEFKGPKSYMDKLAEDQKATGLKEAAIAGIGDIQGITTSFAVTDSRFIMGSMGSVVGEKITRCIERGIEKKIPVVIVSGSGGGARRLRASQARSAAPPRAARARASGRRAGCRARGRPCRTRNRRRRQGC